MDGWCKFNVLAFPQNNPHYQVGWRCASEAIFCLLCHCCCGQTVSNTECRDFQTIAQLTWSKEKAVSEFQVWYHLLFSVTSLHPRFSCEKQGRGAQNHPSSWYVKAVLSAWCRWENAWSFCISSFPGQVSCHCVLTKQMQQMWTDDKLYVHESGKDKTSPCKPRSAI